MELRILLFTTLISLSTGQVMMAISKKKTTLGSPVELVCEQAGLGWRSDWNRDGQLALTVTKTKKNPCLVNWHIDTPVNTEVICPKNSGHFVLRFHQSTIELNGTIWDCTIDDSVGSNGVTIALTEEEEKKVPVHGTTQGMTTGEDTTGVPDVCIQTPSESYLGAGVAIGVSVMLIVDAICLALAFFYKDKVIVKITGIRETSDIEMSGIPISSPVATTTRNQVGPQEAQTPASNNEYEALQRENVDDHNTYEKMHMYQNL